MPFEIFSERKNGETNSKYAYRLLRESIMSFKLLPGEALDETVISEQFGTSRTPVREALILLKNEKLVDILPQKGSKVSFIDLNLVRQGYFTRRVIETAIFKETAGTLSPEQLRNMKTNLQLQEQEINRETTMIWTMRCTVCCMSSAIKWMYGTVSIISGRIMTVFDIWIQGRMISTGSRS